jgi:hypothetical protein
LAKGSSKTPAADSRLFGAQALGGWYASFIEAQDSVATFWLLEAISGEAHPLLEDVEVQNARIVCEWQDDLELHWDSGRIYCQVKNEVLSLAHVKTICDHFNYLLQQPHDPPVVGFRISALAGLAKSIRHLPEQLGQLQHAWPHRSQTDGSRILSAFVTRWGIPSSVALILDIDTRDLRRDSSVARDLFAALLRRSLPVQDFTDQRISQLYRELGNLLATTRRSRTSESVADAFRQLLMRFLPDHLATYEIDYVTTAYGYIKDPERTAYLRAESRLVRRAWRRIHLRWARHISKYVLIDLVFGGVRCPACHHAMIANYFGLRGIACPRCGYQPYLTIAYVCDCAEMVTIEKQPLLDKVRLFGLAIERLRDNSITCESCGRGALLEKLATRLAMIRFPLPVTQYSPKNLVSLRESLGWIRSGWHGPEKGPLATIRESEHPEGAAITSAVLNSEVQPDR